ncbi:hypothetical protein [Schnuerera sp.]|uniref:hypothetical protein n=1 Tax=Schnuerera sp. TaxID=2794844 RepID=UPI002B54A532|nr:hypothetical protein [Schnuerera sp.]HSH35332.1 hypothetical protein [Schnuerera sp.]
MMQENLILVQKQANEWQLFTHKVRFIDNGVESEVYTSDVAWYNKFAEIHDNFSLVEVTEVTYTAEQLSRLEEIKNLNISDSVANDYVIEDIAGEGLELLALKKENNELRQLLADLTEEVLMGGM